MYKLLKVLLCIAGLIALRVWIYHLKNAPATKIKMAQLHGGWRLGDIDPLSEKEESKAFYVWRISMLGEGCNLHFLIDGNVAEVRGTRYRAGRWHIRNANVIVINWDDGTEEKAPFHKRQKHCITVTRTWTDAAAKIVFCRVESPMSEAERDPFHPALNRWRIKPAQPESDAQLYERLINHLEHNRAILEAGLARDISTWSWMHTPTCVQIYNGGIGVKAEKDIHSAFFECFYDRKDARRFIELYTAELEKGIAISATGSWVRDNANLLTLMLDELVSAPRPAGSL